MPAFLSGPGIGLALPQNLFPTELNNAPQDSSSNRLALNAGETFVLPAGDWYVGLGMYLVLQFLDPITNTWSFGAGSAFTRGISHVTSDGFNVRIANLTGCVVGAVINNAGSAYAQASTTVTAVCAGITGALPTLLPIIGGQLGLTGTFTIDVPTKGAGYGVPPIIMIPPPPPATNNANGVGGVPATAYAIIGTSGSISAVSLTNPGAGYPSAPTAVVVPSPFDPNLSVGITAASVSFSLTGSGSITGVLVTNSGSPLPTASMASITLVLGGAGSSGSMTAVVMQTVSAASVSGPGVGYGTSESLITTVGGVPATSAITNPDTLRLAWEPRPANIGLTPANTSVSVGSTGVIYDGGLFLGQPNPILVGAANLAAPTTVASVALVMGWRQDVAILQPAP
jgi:hypothetical protein